VQRPCLTAYYILVLQGGEEDGGGDADRGDEGGSKAKGKAGETKHMGAILAALLAGEERS